MRTEPVDRPEVAAGSRWPAAAALAAVLATGTAGAGEWSVSGLLGLEARGFTGDAAYPEQVEGIQASLVARPEVRWLSSAERSQLMLAPFVRLDEADGERTHLDLRQAWWRYVGDSWEILAGANRVFWGVAESRHLVDVINQVDLVEDVDEEDRLGQPMVSATFLTDGGTVSLYALAGFRERTFPGAEGRLRTPLVVDTKDPVYESAAGSSRVDFAARYSHVLGDWDIGFHVFSGTSREPRLAPGPSGASLVPHYDLMNQAGADLQYTRNAWLWKIEALARETRLDDFAALVGGFEYTFFQAGGSAVDVGILAEYLYDGRDESLAPPTLFDDDIFVGTRLAFNDIQDSSILAGAVIDRNLGSRAISLEVERRIGTGWTLELEGRFFTSVDDEDPMALIGSDDHITLRLSRNL